MRTVCTDSDWFSAFSIPPQSKPNQKTAASHKSHKFLSCHLVRKGSHETLVGGSG